MPLLNALLTAILPGLALKIFLCLLPWIISRINLYSGGAGLGFRVESARAEGRCCHETSPGPTSTQVGKTFLRVQKTLASRWPTPFVYSFHCRLPHPCLSAGMTSQSEIALGVTSKYFSFLASVVE